MYDEPRVAIWGRGNHHMGGSWLSDQHPPAADGDAAMSREGTTRTRVDGFLCEPPES